MDACPRCGAPALGSVAGQYAEEVRKVEPDPDLCARLAPPTRRASIHGFLLGLWVWLLILLPVFELDHGRPLRGTAFMAGLTAVWCWVFVRARATDARLQAAYQARRRCAACGHEA